MNEIDTGLRSTISYMPTAADVSGFILAGKGVDALNFAMSQLVDAGVVWELDSASGVVMYTEKNKNSCGFRVSDGSFHDTAEQAGIAACALSFPSGDWVFNGEFVGVPPSATDPNYKTGQAYCNPKYGTSGGNSGVITYICEATEPVQTAIPIDTVSTQILADIVAGNAVSQSALTQITLNKFANNDFAAALDANAVPYS